MIRRSQRFSTNCAHQLAFQYLKDAFYEYRNERKFMFHAFNLGHNEPAKASSMDNDLHALLKHFNSTGDLDETVVVIFGDHGDRTAEFRKTMQGKLEERLPFVSITVPSWIRQKYPKQYNNLKQNAEILTSHYDLFATAKHILTFPYLPKSKVHRFGKSLFTDIDTLGRKCNDAGVAATWCPCISYKMIDKTDTSVIKMANQVVEKINTYLNVNPVVTESCERLRLKNIMRVRQVTTSKQVEQFVETVKNEECDECGMHLNKTVGYANKRFELLIEVNPSGGQYEMLVDYNHVNQTIADAGPGEVTDENPEIKLEEFMQRISRINKYGDQPNCVARQYPYHRAFCFCKK